MNGTFIVGKFLFMVLKNAIVRNVWRLNGKLTCLNCAGSGSCEARAESLGIMSVCLFLFSTKVLVHIHFCLYS
jgi:hypothetical protein